MKLEILKNFKKFQKKTQIQALYPTKRKCVINSWNCYKSISQQLTMLLGLCRRKGKQTTEKLKYSEEDKESKGLDYLKILNMDGIVYLFTILHN